MTNTLTLTTEELRALMEAALAASDIRAETARSIARALLAAEIDGHKGHGLSRISSYTAQAKSKKIDGQALPKAETVRPGVLKIDVNSGFAYPAFEIAYQKLPDMISETGIACAAFYRSSHFGVAGHHVERLAKSGLIAIAFGNSPKAMAPWGGKQALFGTNPLAFAAPRPDKLPLMIDLALTRVNRASIVSAAKSGDPIPEGWALDKDGQPTTDPNAALEGTMIPIGGAKGAALALMVEILAAVVTGANFGTEATSFFTAGGPPPGVGQFLIAFDPFAIVPKDNYDRRIEALLSMIETQDGARLPGSRCHALRAAAMDNGVTVPANLVEEARAIAAAGPTS
ncbi:(2R)-3-sulfolactate dehydrogenase [bacterium MnTg02]|nr:(2R)-3-sulfolactate dehydrogenase [bacterium MnTg02]